MITNPYLELRDLTGNKQGWHPEWAKQLQVVRTGNTTVYVSHPQELASEQLSELQQLTESGWQVEIDSQRLNRLRVKLWQY